MAKRLSRIERDIERLKEKISEYQQQLKELESAKTEQENLQIIQLVRSMNMKPDEFAAFLRSGALNAAPTATPYHKQEDFYGVILCCGNGVHLCLRSYRGDLRIWERHCCNSWRHYLYADAR